MEATLMAKCVIMFEGTYNGKVIRVPDKMAREIVHEGRGGYASKQAWKDSGRSKIRKEGERV